MFVLVGVVVGVGVEVCVAAGGVLVAVGVTVGVAYKLRELYEYPVPAAYLKTKKKRAEFSTSTVLPITRGTSDIDNTMKPMHDAMMDALGFDDSQIVSIEAHKRYKTGDTYRYSFELYEMPSGVELEFYI